MTKKFTVAGGCGDPNCDSCGGSGARTVSADEIAGGPPDAETSVGGADADTTGEGSPGWLSAARDAAPSVPDGWRPQGLFTADDGDDSDETDAPDPDRPTGIFSEPERTDDAVEQSRRDSLPGPGPEEYEPDDADAGGEGPLVDYDDIVQNARGDYKGKAGPDPRKSEPSGGGRRSGVNYAGMYTAQSPDTSGEDDDDEYRPSPILTADPDGEGGEADE